MAPVIRRFREERIVWSGRYFMEALKLPDQLYPAHIRMWSEYLWRWYSFFLPCWRCILVYALYLLISLYSTCMYKSSFRGSFFFVCLPSWFHFQKGHWQLIYSASPFAWVAYLHGWLSLQILSLWDLSAAVSVTHDPAGHGGVEGTLCWGHIQNPGSTGTWELVNDASCVCDASSKPNDCPPPHIFSGETGWMCKTARPVGVTVPLFS